MADHDDYSKLNLLFKNRTELCVESSAQNGKAPSLKSFGDMIGEHIYCRSLFAWDTGPRENANTKKFQENVAEPKVPELSVLIVHPGRHAKQASRQRQWPHTMLLWASCFFHAISKKCSNSNYDVHWVSERAITKNMRCGGACEMDNTDPPSA